jgi:hypothetical protein
VTELSSAEIFAIVLIVVICAAMAGVGLLFLQRLRRRRDQLRGELSQRPEAVGDRAFNRIAMARREADLLSSQGMEISRARELVGEAQASFDSRKFDRAYELAQSAHETLVAARRQPASAPRPAAFTAAEGARDTRPKATDAPVPSEAIPPAPKIPAHRAESQFQLRLLEEELARARSTRANDGHTLQAQALFAQARQAFDRADYAEAFRLALKGRREAGGSVEALAPPPRGKPAGGTGPAEASEVAPNEDLALAAAAVASADRCLECGHPMTSEETFCRGCGSPRKATA